MRWLKWQREVGESNDEGADRLAKVEAMTLELRERVRRLERESEVYRLAMKRDLRKRGIAC